MNKKRNTAQGRLYKLGIHSIAALVCTIITAAALLSAFSAIMCKIDIPIYMIVPFATLSASAAAFTASCVLAYLEGEKGLLCGIGTGIIIFLILWAASAISGNFSLTGLAALKLIAYCTAGCIGGMLGVSLKEKKLKRR